MFSLLQVSLQGFLQCSIFLPQNTLYNIFAFKSVAETTVWCWGGVSESKLYTHSLLLVGVALMSLLNNPVALIMTASLIIQIIVLFLLIYGYILKRKLKFRQHGITMTTAFILHLSLVFYVMIPSFVIAVVPDYIVPAPLQIVSIVGLIHGILGITTLSLGVYLVGSWRLSKNIQGCINRKKYMLKTLTVWITTLAFGITLYAILIGPVLNA
jgi:uncharacterized membrane protein YozB (DUF420 family)